MEDITHKGKYPFLRRLIAPANDKANLRAKVSQIRERTVDPNEQFGGGKVDRNEMESSFGIIHKPPNCLIQCFNLLLSRVLSLSCYRAEECRFRLTNRSNIDSASSLFNILLFEIRGADID